MDDGMMFPWVRWIRGKFTMSISPLGQVVPWFRHCSCKFRYSGSGHARLPHVDSAGIRIETSHFGPIGRSSVSSSSSGRQVPPEVYSTASSTTPHGF